MQEISNLEILDINGCWVKDEKGIALASLHEDEGYVVVERTPACSIGMYFYILMYLTQLGFNVK